MRSQNALMHSFALQRNLPNQSHAFGYVHKAVAVTQYLSIFVHTECLEVVFRWLGFEVLTKQNCNRHQILQELRDLAARDHTSMDCVVCSVLSHGQIKGIVGVDGQIVTYKELIETLSPSQCPSLFSKPKLFFIQACRGTKDQPAAFPQIFPDDEVMPVSDAAVPRDSIPEMADYLLAMSTVPHYVSYREKDTGTWFIQSLCYNLKQLVPRWASLSLVVLTGGWKRDFEVLFTQNVSCVFTRATPNRLLTVSRWLEA